MATHINRRDLLKLSAGATVGCAATASIMGASDTPRQLEPLSGSVFGHSERTVPMNAANLTPLLQPVAERIVEYSRQLNQDVSFINRRAIVSESVTRSREMVAAMLGISDSVDLAFVRNTSEANSIINNGLELEAGDEVLLWNQNHSTNNRSWQYRQQRFGFSVKEVLLPEEIRSTQQIVDAFVSKLTRNTKVVTFTELSNISGLRMPSKQICQAVHDYNPDIFVHVDGAQSWGCLDVNIEDMGCDSFSSSAHKWFMGPRGTGILYVNKKWASKVWPNTLGYDFLMNYPEESLPETASRFECIGQRDVAPYAAIGDGVDAFNQLGGSLAVEKKIQTLTQYALTQLDAVGVKTVTPKNRENGKSFGHGVVVADLGGSIPVYGAFLALQNEGIASAFVSGAKVCCELDRNPPTDELPTYLRLSPHIYNSKEDVDRAVQVIQRIQNSKFEIVKEVVRFL